MVDTKSPVQSQYGQPKDRVLDQARSHQDIAVIGRDQDGKLFLWATKDRGSTESMLRDAFPDLIER